MWRSCRKSSAPINRTILKSFSFKDIETLCSENNSNSSSSPSPSPNLFSFKPNTTTTTNASVFHRVLRATAVLRAFSTPHLPPAAATPLETTPPSPPHNEEADQSEPPSILIPSAETRIVVYLTSLRVVRSTFEACRTVQSILRGFRVTVDERDLSMDSAFMEELQRILNIHEKTKVTLPRVFIGILKGNSTGQSSSPNYLRASTGSCHEFCKYGKEHSFAVKARNPKIKRGTPPSDKQKSNETEVLAQKKKTWVGKHKPSPDIKIHSPEQNLRTVVLPEKKKTFEVKLKPSLDLIHSPEPTEPLMYCN